MCIIKTSRGGGGSLSRSLSLSLSLAAGSKVIKCVKRKPTHRALHDGCGLLSRATFLHTLQLRVNQAAVCDSLRFFVRMLLYYSCNVCQRGWKRFTNVNRPSLRVVSFKKFFRLRISEGATGSWTVLFAIVGSARERERQRERRGIRPAPRTPPIFSSLAIFLSFDRIWARERGLSSLFFQFMKRQTRARALDVLTLILVYRPACAVAFD